MKRLTAFFVLIWGFLAAVSLFPAVSQAASANVEFSSKSNQYEEGKEFTVVCRVSSNDVFSDVEMTVLYDAGRMEFIRGGSKVSGANGVLRIASSNNTDEVTKRTYSLRFRALTAGDASVGIGDEAVVSDLDGETFSVSSNRLMITVSSPKRSVAGHTAIDPRESAPAASTSTPAPETTLSTNNKLKSLYFDCLSMTPEFDTNVLDYTIHVDCNTNRLYCNYTAANKKARVWIKNNEELITGENQVSIVVAAESGDKRVFNLQVIKESESETKVREQEEKGGSDITFAVFERDGAIYIQNQYQFQVVDVEDDDIIPSGYVKSSVELEGKSVPAYTMENDLDNNYLLMYLKGASGEPTLYQYDRQEKTLQRYTGTMTQKVNQGGNVAQEVEAVPEMWLYGVIVALTVIIITLLIVILNMVLRRKVGKGKKELDDLDF